jgi:hypothetical protein
MTVPPLDIDGLASAQRARLAAESLDRKTIASEVGDLGQNINDLLAGAGALAGLVGWIEEGKHDDLLPAARLIVNQMEGWACDLCNVHVELSNKLGFWAEKEEPKP